MAVCGLAKAAFLSNTLLHANPVYTHQKDPGSLLFCNLGPIDIMSQREDNVSFLFLSKAHRLPSHVLSQFLLLIMNTKNSHFHGSFSQYIGLESLLGQLNYIKI